MPIKEPASNFLGKKFSKLTITEDLGIVKGNRKVLALCDCGTLKEFHLGDIKRGASPSCGCVKKERISNLKRTHSLKHHPLYKIWRGILNRCYNPNGVGFDTYGGKGVTVCDEWRHNFSSFYNWAMANGWQKGLVIDKDKRSPNQTGNEYSPDFCSVITGAENSFYKSTSKMLTYKDETRSLAEWAGLLNLNYQAVKDRINTLKWSVEKAFETPVRKIKK